MCWFRINIIEKNTILTVEAADAWSKKKKKKKIAIFIKQKMVDAKSEKMARFFIGRFIFLLFVIVLCVKP